MRQEKTKKIVYGGNKMKRDFLKGLELESDVIDKIMAQYGADIENFKAANNEQADKIKALENDIKTRDEQLEALKNSTGDIEALKAQIDTLQNENKAATEKYQNELRQVKLNNAVEKALTNANAKNSKVVLPLLSEFLNNAEIDDEGNVKDLEKQIKTLIDSEETSFLFEQPQVEKQTVLKGVTPSSKADAQPTEQVDFSKMSYTQICEYMEANPDAKL